MSSSSVVRPKPQHIVVPNDDTLLRIPQAAAVLNVKPSTIRAWILKKQIPFVQLSARAIRFRRADLDSFVTARLTPARAE